jgi:predicted kinase
MKLIMTKGLPGSGKTTWAYDYLKQQPNTVLVCKDDLRAMMFNSAWTGPREKTILSVRDFIVIQGLHEGKDVIVHDTNLAPKHQERLARIAREHKAEFFIQEFTQVPIEQCIHNDLRREDSVGEKVIRDMYRDWLQPKPVPPEYLFGAPNAIVCDLDGTLALFGDANPYDRDFLQDSLNIPVANILLANKKWQDIQVILVSGRTDKFLEQTHEWLRRKNVPYDRLYMRKDGDVRKDNIVKKEIYDSHIKDKFNVQFVLDDRNQVVDFWRSLGIPCFQVAPGDF